MKNLAYRILWGLAATLIFVGCSSKDEEPETVSMTFYGEFIDLIPRNTLSEETVNPEEAIAFMLSNGVEAATNDSHLIIDEMDADLTKSAYTFKINGSLAYYELETEKGSTGMKVEYDITTYRFKTGKYKVETEDSAPYERFIVVTTSEARVETYYNGAPTDNVFIILRFEDSNSSYSLYRNRQEIEPCYAPLREGYTRSEDYGKAILNSDGTFSLVFDFYTFTLDPDTGTLTRLKPDYLEIGTLGKVVRASGERVGRG